MPKFIIDVSLDGYGTKEDMLAACNTDSVREALRDYGFNVNLVDNVQIEKMRYLE